MNILKQYMIFGLFQAVYEDLVRLLKTERLTISFMHRVSFI